MTSHTHLALLLAVISLCLWRWINQSRRIAKLPPGPKGWPIIGNALEMPRAFEYKRYQQWSREFNSDIIYLSALGQPIIVLDKYETAIDLLEKRSGIYSSRPYVPMLKHLGWGTANFVMTPYGDRWRHRRRLFSQAVNEKTNARFYPLLQDSTHLLLKNLLATPEKFMQHMVLIGASAMFLSVYGITISSIDDPLFVRYEKAMHILIVSSSPGAFLVNTFPMLEYLPSWIPGGSFKQYARYWASQTKIVVHDTYEQSKKMIEQGSALPSFISASLEEAGQELSEKDDEALSDTAATMTIGGTETTSAVLKTFILAMVLHPAIQATAQEEITRVCDQTQLPSIDDMKSLPYITAIVLEILRWNTTVPSGGPRYIEEDDIYNGYLIPGGSILLPNQWSMLRDETTYPDPHSFKPERFLKDGILNPDIRDPREIVFGFGRRICPGRYLAFSFSWIAICSMLTTFDTKATDETNLSQSSGYFAPGVVSHPAPFKCSIKPRSQAAVELIRSL